MKVTSKGNIIRETADELAKKTELQIQSEIDNYEMQDRLESILAKEELYKNLSPVETVKQETREWFDKLTWYKYDEFRNRVKEMKKETIVYLEIETFNNDEKVKYLSNESSKFKKLLVKNAIGRELLTNFTLEFFLQLYNDTKQLIVFNDKGEQFNFCESESKEISKNFADYTAVLSILDELNPIVPTDPHLREVTTPANYKAIMKGLAEEGIIDRETNNWIPSKEYSKSFMGALINYLAYTGLIQHSLNDSMVKSIARKTFNLSIGDVNAKNKKFEHPMLKIIRKKIQK